MAIVALTDGGSTLAVRSGRLIVVRDEVETALQTAHVDEVQLHGAAELTATARNRLLREGIDAAFFTADGRYLGRLSAAANGRVAARRLAWYGFVADPARRLPLARAIIASKITAQRRVLLTRQQRARHPQVADALVRLRVLLGALDAAPSAESLLGHEGAAAAAFYGALPPLITHPDMPFGGRTRRPPRDGINAALSFGYALLLSRVEHALWRAGMEPGLGVLHSPDRGAPALALDLMEEARPVIDDLVLTLVNRRQLGPDDVHHPSTDPDAGLDDDPDPTAVHLTRTGRTILLRAWARALATPHHQPGQERALPLEQLLQQQAHQLAALAEGRAETFTPLTLEL